jgi:hypothetical protein
MRMDNRIGEGAKTMSKEVFMPIIALLIGLR